ncbi:hypothetical protein [uncultured Chryseobacterium sp.]|uniref:hypothetical protein n=1 Tax=uncultured Chryseobacterium sp. TaxID=259322 RepID=UPI0025FC66D6|nr:hypothetical protein [uncultured Chryseobacterium sp.]
MKNPFNEKNHLPITFKYIEMIRRKRPEKKSKNVVYYIPCEKYETTYYVREKPFKSLIRML